jgi:type I restriction enzyme R subunit
MKLKPEERARTNIDRMLKSSGWVIQDLAELNLGISEGVAIREFPIGKDHADYLLFIDRTAVGVVEAKPEGTTLSGIAEQSQNYLTEMLKTFPNIKVRPIFGYETTGVETFFRDLRDPDTRSRRVFSFHRPETLLEWMEQQDTLRTSLRKTEKEHPLIKAGLRDCQYEAIKNLEKSFFQNRPRSLVQMATGTGKTYTAVSFVYRLIKFGKAKRILFLVDRRTLGGQAFKEFQNYVTPDDGRKFTELYNVQLLNSRSIDPVSKVVITTIQRLFSILKNEEFDEETEDISLFDIGSALETQKPKDVTYNPKIPVEMFDFIITDECHRSIYNLWRQVLEYFDAFIIGLTATPSKQTIGFFNNNLVMEYTHEQAVADNVNVGYEVYRIKTRVSEEGGLVEAGNIIDRRDKLTRKQRWEQLDQDLEYDAGQLDRNVVTPDQIRMIIRTFRDKLFTEIFPGRKEVPKTLIFAKDDTHAEDIVNIVKEEFGKGNEFCKKITYRTTGEKPEDLISSFRNSYNPRIAVTVDMISTGTDIKPLECLIFMRDVKSSIYFEQMKGRGSRVINSDDFNTVTPDSRNKTHFVIVDAIGVCETLKNDSSTLERKKGVAFDKLLNSIAIGNRDVDTLKSMGGRLARLEREIDEGNKKEIEAIAGKPMRQLIKNLIEAHDPDRQIEKAKEIFKINRDIDPSSQQLKEASGELVKIACEPFDNPKLRNIIIDIKRKNEQIIDRITTDTLLSADYDINAKQKSRTIVDTFKKFIEQNKDELTALQIIYGKPYMQRQLVYEDIQQLAEAIRKPPYLLDTDVLWRAYEQLQKSKVKKVGPKKLLTDIISLVRFTTGQEEILEPFSETVDQKFSKWLGKQERLGKKFENGQLEWLTMIKNHISTSVTITKDDFELSPFYEKGGPVKVYQLFGRDLDYIMSELNEVLVT